MALVEESELVKEQKLVKKETPLEQFDQEAEASSVSSTESPPPSLLSDIEELILLSTSYNPPSKKNKVVEFIHKYHFDAPELIYLMSANLRLLDFGLALEGLTNDLQSKSPDKQISSAASYLLASGYHQAADFVALLEGLGLKVNEYISLMYPEIQGKEVIYLTNTLERWRQIDQRVLREKAKKCLDNIDRGGSKTMLRGPFMDGDKSFGSRDMGRLGKKARGLDLAMVNASVGKRLVGLNLDDLKGNSVALENYSGKVVIIYIWSSGCQPCLESMPYYQSLAEKLKRDDQAFQMITLSVDDTEADLRQVVEQNSMPFINCWIGKNNRLQYEWDITAFPTTILLDASGIIRAKGTFDKLFLTKAIDTLINN